jgi:hypothetical protein
VWLGTTKPFEAFTFYFNETEHGLFQVHAYRYEEGKSTFIVECSEETFFKAGMDKASEEETDRLLREGLREGAGRPPAAQEPIDLAAISRWSRTAPGTLATS